MKSGRKPIHGKEGTRIYRIWHGMKQRCKNTKAKDYHRYGGRGIMYDPKWESFQEFYRDMREGYSNKLTLERVNVNGNYCKDNCTWATPREQGRNRRNTITVIYQGEEQSLCEIYEKYNVGIPYNQFSTRIHKYGWDVDKAIATPINQHKREYKKKIIYKGMERLLIDVYNELKLEVTYKTVLHRITDLGWSVEDALNHKRGEWHK